jgi:GntR family transcriptional repressor for pyruvate dehydrogenase complex
MPRTKRNSKQRAHLLHKYHLFNLDHEIAFHGNLYGITSNETLKKFQRMLLPAFDYVHKSGLLKKQP